MGKAKNLLFTACLEHFGQIRPDSHIWLFSSTDNSHYNYNSRYLFEYVKENLPEITPLFVINDPELRNSLSSKYGKQYFIETESIQGIRQALSAGVWFTSAGLPAYGTGLHKKRLIINLWHGVPLKKIALLDPNLKKAARIYFKKIFSENYTCILTTSHELIPLMARSFAVSEDKIKVWGQPRNDGLFQKNDCREILGQLFPDLPEYTTTVLYAQLSAIMDRFSCFRLKILIRNSWRHFLRKRTCCFLYGLMLPNRVLLLHTLEKEFVFLEMNRLKMSPVF